MQMNKPSPRLAILRAQLAAKADDESFARALYSYSAQNPRTLRALPPLADSLPLPPSYWDDLEHWLKTLAPAKPAAPKPEPTAGVWHSEAPSVAGVYIASAFRDVNRLRWFDGRKWHQDVSRNASAAEARCSVMESTIYQSRVQWLCLIEADAPAARLASTSGADVAALVGAKLTHSVCIKEYTGATGFKYVLGYVCPVPFDEIVRGDKAEVARCWLPCDKDGFIPHTPTADSVCPVPAGVHFVTLLFGGATWLRPDRTVDGGYGGTGDCNCIKWDAGTSVIAWRPIAKDAS